MVGHRFLEELKRRRVLNTTWLYILGGWVVLQVAEVLAGAGLPPAALRYLLGALMVGLVPVLVLSWCFDVSREGFRRTLPLSADQSPPAFRFFDRILLLGLLVVVGSAAWVLSLPSPTPVDGQASPVERTIAVLGFDDRDLAAGSDGYGDAFAAELRESLTRIAGLRVLGPETSRLLNESGAAIMDVAEEMRVTAMVKGDLAIRDNRVDVEVQLTGVPAGNVLWTRRFQQPMESAVALQHTLARELVAAIAPDLDPDPVHGQRSEAGHCSRSYDLYLRGRQLVSNNSQAFEAYQRGKELLQEAVALDERCAVAWEALAVSHVNWEMSGFAQAGAAARRALELNDKLPMAWAVLAEIAEQERRWDEAEEYFLRALYSDPTNAHVNHFYAEALMARGRHEQALRYALDAYRYEPGSRNINYKLAMVALRVGKIDLALEHAEVVQDLSHNFINDGWDLRVQAAMLEGRFEHAVEIVDERESILPDWVPQCIMARKSPESSDDLANRIRDTLSAIQTRQFEKSYLWGWAYAVRCAIWLDEVDLAFDQLQGDEVPTELQFMVLFHPDSAILRRDARFRSLVLESGLDDYWRKWGWADVCRPVADDFACD